MRERLEALRRLLPQGSSLPEDAWWSRHRAIVVLLWVHAALIPTYAVIRGYSIQLSLLESAIVPAAAIVAGRKSLSRRVRTAAASLGLLSSSAVLVHLSGGLIEMHFHFFVMVAVVALYQDWIPFLASIGYVLVHHGVIGALAPASVFNHPAAQNRPWMWAAIHALFIAGISAACLVTWRLNETILAQRKQAEDRLRTETHLVETLNEVGKTLAAELDLDRVVQTVTDAATRLTHADFGAFFYNVVDERGDSSLVYSISGAPRDVFSKFPLPRNTELFGTTFRGEGVVRLDDVTLDSRYGRNTPYHGMPPGHLPVKSYLAAPVKSRTGEVLGGLFFGHPLPTRFTAIDERIVVGIASHAAVAIDNARLYQSERNAKEAAERAQRRLGILAEASRVLTSSLELDAILKNLGRLVTPAIADTCVIDVREEDGSLRRVVSQTDPEMQELADRIKQAPPDAANEHHPVIQVMRSGTPQLIGDVPDALMDAAFEGRTDDRDTVKQLQPTSALIVPLQVRDEIIGALSLSTSQGTGRRLGTDELQLTEELARRAASAIDNARLYARQRTAAELLQHSLLPEKLPELPGIAAAARYIAGGPPSMEIGGDWYDVFEVPDGSLVLVMGDVVGRGVRAASLMGQLRNALRAYMLEGHRPPEAMRKLNDYLHELGPAEHMATLVLAKFEPDTGSLTLTNAGHPPPLVVGPTGEPRFVEEGASIPIGAMQSVSYTETSLTLSPGCTLILYTDGLIEDRDLSIDEGLERLQRAASDSTKDLEGLCDHILERALAGRAAGDDVAVLALRSLALGDRLHMTLPARPAILKPLRATLRRWLIGAGASDEEIFEILVASGEACTNAIQHATGAAAQNFEIEAALDGEVFISVRDNGRWRRPRADGGGRGLGIMQEYMDEVNLIKGPDGTEVQMRRMLTRVPV
jgi:serine phosphatase RsbU (regulator of sigma subunit)/anti-sigma regulatory factor (Ser/Thr protein kinase)